ncbi:MAG: DUF433 domain-containing protein [Cyclobacteriaceae bacterium]|nr:DUF433 domain-containing protein [Cyclobacteriaceae bacterium]
MERYHHITFDQRVLGGKPIIRGTRVSVELILEWIASGASVGDICQRYPHLSEEAVREAIHYANDISKNEILIESKM